MLKEVLGINSIMKAPPRCPLCHAPMTPEYDSARKVFVFCCHRDRIAIRVDDPLVGKWEEKMEKIPCPNCDSPMRVFFTSVGYMKAKCPKPKCGCTVSGSNPDHKTAGHALTGDGIAAEGRA